MTDADPTEDAQPIDTTDGEDAQLLLADPDDYHRAQRLKEIHDARQKAAKARRNAADKYTDVRRKQNRRNLRHGYVARHVHQYAIELEPMIDAIGDLDAEWPDDLPWADFKSYLGSMGYVPGDCPAAVVGDGRPDENKSYPAEGRCSTNVYRYLNRVLAEIRPMVEEDDSNDWEV